MYINKLPKHIWNSLGKYEKDNLELCVELLSIFKKKLATYLT